MGAEDNNKHLNEGASVEGEGSMLLGAFDLDNFVLDLETEAQSGAPIYAQLIELEDFEVAFSMPTNKQEETLRRFSTLLVDTGSSRKYGSNGMVSKAQNPFGEVFAIKRLRAGLEHTPLPDIPAERASSGAVAAFRTEFESQLILSSLKGFPKLYGYGNTNTGPIILMEWIEGISLADAMDDPAIREKLTPETIFAIGAELYSILANLDSLASRPVHRDLSPANVMIRTSKTPLIDQINNKNFDLCIIDFGSTTVIDEQDPRFTSITNILRHGTPEYTPPEMLTDTLPNVIELRQSPSIDIYAAASIIYELLLGRTPFEISKHVGEVPYLVKTTQQFPPLYLPEYPTVNYAINTALSNDQASRPRAEYMRDVFLNALDPSVALPATSQGAGFATSAPQPYGSPYVTSTIHTLNEAQGGASVMGASFEHPNLNNAPSAGSVPPSTGTAPTAFTNQQGAPAKRKKLPKVIIAVVAVIAALVIAYVGVFVVPGLLNSEGTAAQNGISNNGDSSSSIPYGTYTAGSLYAAEDPDTGLWGYLNAQRQWAIAPQFEESPGLFVDGLASAKDSSTGLYGYIDTTGQWAIKPQFPVVNMFGEGRAFVQSSSDMVIPEDGTAGLGGWIDTQGNWVISPKYYGGGIFKNGYVSFSTDADHAKWGLLDVNGEVILPDKYRDVKGVGDDGLVLLAEHVYSYGWADIDGNWVIKPKYAQASSFHEDLAAVMDGVTEKWGYIDTSGNIVIPLFFQYARNFKSGVAAVQDPDTGLWGYIDKTGTWAIYPKFALAGDFAHGLAPVQDDETQLFGYIDDTGQWVIPPQFSDVNLNIMD